MTHVLTDIAPNGDAVIAYVEDTGTIGPVPLQVAVRTKATGTWATEDLGEVEGLWAVAMSPAADAIVLTADRRAGDDAQHLAPAGGRRLGREAGGRRRIDTTNSAALRDRVRARPQGGAGRRRAADLRDRWRQRCMTAVRGAGHRRDVVGPRASSRRSTTRAGGILAIDAATHPGGVVLGWIEQQNGAFASDLAVARFNGTSFDGAEALRRRRPVHRAVGRRRPRPARAIVAAQHETDLGRNRIMVAEADGIDRRLGRSGGGAGHADG